jgi:hypothetical protein
LITCYAQPDKVKSQRVLQAFAAGCGGRLSSTAAGELMEGDAAFYGVRPAWMHLWQQAVATRRQWYWLDNAWFDKAREQHFRIGRNALQSWSHKASDGKRLAQLGVQVHPWRKDGAHIVVCGQSDEFMRTAAGWPQGAAGWSRKVTRLLANNTDRPLVARIKLESKPLAEDLRDAWLLVTHSSAAAIEALIAGVPVIVTDPNCAASGFSTAFADVEAPARPDGREEWAARLADSQWTLDELRSGAWNKKAG